MERRRSPRLPIDLAALVHPPQGRSWLCGIRDFCAQGMLLEIDNPAHAHLVARAGLAPGDALGVQFSVPTPQGSQSFKVAAQVARIIGDGRALGVSIVDGMPEAAFAAMLRQARPLVSEQADDAASGRNGGIAELAGRYAGTAHELADLPLALLRARRLAHTAAGRVRESVHDLARAALDNLGDAFLRMGEQWFLVAARDAGNQLLQQAHLEALDFLERHGRAALVRPFTAGVLTEIVRTTPLETVLERRRRRETGDDTELSVVDTEGFEDWLLVIDLIAKMEARFAPQLLALRARLGLVEPIWAHREALPVGPAILCWAFADATRGAGLRRSSRHAAQQPFEQALQAQLGAFYDGLIRQLDESGLLPAPGALTDILAALAERPRSSVFETPAPAPAGAAAHAGSAIGTSAALPGTLVPMHWAGGYPPGLERAVGIVPVGATLGGATMLAAGPGSAAVADGSLPAWAATYQTIRRLAHVARGASGDGSDPGHSAPVTGAELLRGLVDSLQQDERLTEGARDWVQRLADMLGKVAADDPGLFAPDALGQPHPALALLNQLARVGSARDVRDGIDREVGRRVDELLERLLGEFDRDPGVLRGAVAALEPLIERQERGFAANLDRTARAAEGQYRLRLARRAVVAALTPLLADRAVPVLALRLLNPGWRNLLVNAHLRGGPDCADWQHGLAVATAIMDRLERVDAVEHQTLATSDDDASTDALLQQVVVGLNRIGFDPARRTPLVMALAAATAAGPSDLPQEPCSGDGDLRQRPPIERVWVALDAVGEMLGFARNEVEPDPAAAPRDTEATASGLADWRVARDRAARLARGDRLAAADADRRPQILTVAHAGADPGPFTLVNRLGIKVREVSLGAMTDAFCRGLFTLIEDDDLPSVERASQRLLENLHTQLAFQAAHDELTTLLNRREFERLATRVVQTARTRGTNAALLYVDLDQFKIVNSTSGHSVGDELLKRVAGVLSERFAGPHLHIARLGGDEFGLLAEHVDAGAAGALAERVQAALRESPFALDGHSHSVTASIGLVLIDRETRSVDAAMRHADEACYAAKASGRNRIRTYRDADTDIRSRHGIMQSVAHLDRALAEDRLVLNCQAIAPVFEGAEGDMHYEILLTMRTPEGELVPPSEFIQGAETYQRIALLDRWVVSRVLAWMAANPEALVGVSGMGINLSGQSVGDAAFADFVLDAFARTGAPTAKVCFEITETTAILNLDQARDFMQRMKSIGCRFALDDFGTGLSSYSYLRHLPVDMLKIDGIFIRQLAENAHDLALVRSINEIGHYLGKRTIAECVETAAVLECVREIGIDYAQGYHIGRPQPLDELFRKPVAV